MGTISSELDDDARAFIAAQHMFFVATAPASVSGESGEAGHINLSPKGLDGTFAVLDERTVAYLDLTGSGIETLAHARSDGRICVMFCAFEGLPKILRLYGRVDALEPGHPEFADLVARFPEHLATRAVLRVSVTRVSTSCGYGVPLFDYRGQRDILPKWGLARSPEQVRAYQDEHNLRSIDGLPGLRE